MVLLMRGFQGEQNVSSEPLTRDFKEVDNLFTALASWRFFKC